MRARLTIDPERILGTIDPNIYGQFLSRRPGCSEGGLYDPDAPTADQRGIRRDVSQAIADLKPPLIRWPGGCTGTSYHWLDGVGPRGHRPQTIDLHFGWPVHYDFGTAEFITWCRSIGAEPHLNLAMGTGTLDEAAAWLEYCNGSYRTRWAELRRQHGYEEPFAVQYWQLGNEMFGPWEIGYCQPAEYAVTAREWAKVLRRLDPTIRLLAVGGNSNDNGQWAWEVFPVVAPYVDYVTFHSYWRTPEAPGSDPWYHLLAGPHEAERKIEQLATIADTVYRTAPANSRPAARRVHVACTEWNTMPGKSFMEGYSGIGSFQPSYHLHDALAVATFSNILTRHCRQITLATIAQSINVVGLIMVDQHGMWREPTYWAWYLATNYHGPTVLDPWLSCDTFSCPERLLDGLPILDIAVTLDDKQQRLYLSLVNRHERESIDLDVKLIEAATTAEDSRSYVLYHDDPQAMNLRNAPETVQPRTETVHLEGSRWTYALLPHSYTVLSLALAR